MGSQNNAENMSSNIVVLAFYYLLVMLTLKIHLSLVYYGEPDTTSRLYKCNKLTTIYGEDILRSFTQKYALVSLTCNTYFFFRGHFQ